MSIWYLATSCCYLVLGLVVWWYEARRVRHAGADLITVFLAFCLLQTCVAAIAIYGLLPFIDPATPTTNPVFDRILQATNPTNAFLVLCLTAWFVVWFYVGCALAALLLPRSSVTMGRYRLAARGWRLAGVLLFGLAITLYSFVQMGDTFAARYVSLILFRDLSDAVPRTPLRATAFALTQTWSWLSVLSLFLLYEGVGRRWLKGGVLAIAIIFALLGVSRRALFLPLLLAYLSLVLHRRRWYLGWIVLFAIPAIIWLAFGKELFGAIAFGLPLDAVIGTYRSLPSALLRAASELGITVIESLGTLAFIPEQLRFGVDHILSLAQRFPEGMLGFDIDWPARMVRISTEAFASHEAPDVPPGFLGQMWIDFRVFGPVVWGVLLGLQMGALQWLFGRTERTLSAAAAGVLLALVVSLPVNTGSFDFTFSIDIIILLLVMLACLRLRPSSLYDGGWLEVQAPGGGRDISGVSAADGL